LAAKTQLAGPLLQATLLPLIAFDEARTDHFMKSFTGYPKKIHAKLWYTPGTGTGRNIKLTSGSYKRQNTSNFVSPFSAQQHRVRDQTLPFPTL
jgi:hypothetical protein